MSIENISYADYTTQIDKEKAIQADTRGKLEELEAEEKELLAQLKQVQGKTTGNKGA